jgi:adenylate cyclase
MSSFKAPLKVTILTTVMAVVIGCSGVLVAANYFEDRNIIIESANRWMSSISSATAQRLERFFDEARLIADVTAGMPPSAITLDDPAMAHRYLVGILKRHEASYSAYFADSNGSFIQAIDVGGQPDTARKTLGFPDDTVFALRVIHRGPYGAYQRWQFEDAKGNLTDGPVETGVEYDPRVRPWFATALASNFTVNTEPYIFQSLRRPGVTFSRAMHHMDGAVFGLDISVTQLSEFLNQQKFGERSRLSITDNSELLIASDDVENYLRLLESAFNEGRMPSRSDVEDTVLAEALKQDVSSDEAVIFDAGATQYLLSQREVSGPATTKWHISVVAPADQFTGPMVDSMYRSMLFAGALIIFIVVPGVFVLASWITAPMLRVAEDADRIRKFDFRGYKPRRTIFREIAQLSEAMAAMRQAIDAFSRYVPKDVVFKLFESGQVARIGGKRQRVTILFTDIAGFTVLSEGTDPEFLMEHTAVYFESLTRAISDHNGTIDKFIGDAIMALWNAPLEDPDHLYNACRGVLAARQASEDLNAIFREKERPVLFTRFGLHSGDAVVGNMGASSRMGYTSLGDTVNLSARLEGLNKFYGTQILVSEPVQAETKDRFHYRIVDLVVPKGTSVPVGIYELVGAKSLDDGPVPDDWLVAFIARFKEAFTLYQGRKFEEALAIFRSLLAEKPDDGPASIMVTRCKDRIASPPGPEWTGAQHFGEK